MVVVHELTDEKMIVERNAVRHKARNYPGEADPSVSLPNRMGAAETAPGLRNNEKNSLMKPPPLRLRHNSPIREKYTALFTQGSNKIGNWEFILRFAVGGKKGRAKNFFAQP
jgi:hypothetical protein